MHSLVLRIALLVPLVVTAQTATAANEVTALITLGPLDITLIDLDPQDGVSPSFRWTQNAWTNEIERQAYFHVNGVASNLPDFSNPKRTQIAGDMITTVPGEASYAQVLGDLQGLSVFLSMKPGPTPRLAFGNAEFNLDPSGRYHDPESSGTGEGVYFGSDYTFEVSANTAVVFSSMVSGSLENNAAALGHSARASAFLHAGVLENEQPDDYSDPHGIPWYPNVHDGSGEVEIGYDSDGIARGFGAAWSSGAISPRLLSVRYDNTGGASGFGYFYAGASAQLNTAAVAVPEPAAGPTIIAIGAVAFASHKLRTRGRRRTKRHFS